VRRYTSAVGLSQPPGTLPVLPAGFLRCIWPLRRQLEGSPVMGTMILAAGSTKSGGNPTFTFIILAVLVGLFYLLIMRPQRNR